MRRPEACGSSGRTAASDAAASIAVQAIYNEVAKASPTGSVRLAFLNKADAYGEGMIPGITTGLLVNGAAPVPWNVDVTGGTDPDGGTTLAGGAAGNFYRHQFNVEIGEENEEADGGTADGGSVAGPELGQMVADLNAFKPTIIILVGTEESLNVINAYETALTKAAVPTASKPTWVLVDGQREASLFAIASKYPDLAARLRGEVPGVPSQLQADFAVRFTKAFASDDPSTYGSTQAYDIGYSVAYALATSQGKTVTGDLLATGMGDLVGGAVPIDFSPTGLTQGFASILGGSKIDINGTSGPLQFDLTTGEALTDYTVWCLQPNASTYVFNDATGETYSAKTSQLVGTFACPQ